MDHTVGKCCARFCVSPLCQQFVAGTDTGKAALDTAGDADRSHAGTRHCKHSQPEIIISGIFECETQTA